MMKLISMAAIFIMLTGCCRHANYNAPKITFDNPPDSKYDCTVTFTDAPEKMVITCVDKPLAPIEEGTK